MKPTSQPLNKSNIAYPIHVSKDSQHLLNGNLLMEYTQIEVKDFFTLSKIIATKQEGMRHAYSHSRHPHLNGD